MTCSLMLYVLAILADIGPDNRPCGGRGEVECVALASDIAEGIEWAHAATGTPTMVLLQIGLTESRLNPRAVNAKTGAWGVFGLMPGTYWSNIAAASCSIDPGGCIQHQAMASAVLLAMSRRRCGSWRGAITAYASRRGRCESDHDYLRKFKRSKNRMRL